MVHRHSWDVISNWKEVVFFFQLGFCRGQVSNPGVPGTYSPPDGMPIDEPTGKSNIESKTWTGQPVPIYDEQTFSILIVIAGVVSPVALVILCICTVVGYRYLLGALVMWTLSYLYKGLQHSCHLWATKKIIRPRIGRLNTESDVSV